jgi:hypothetical protein
MFTEILVIFGTCMGFVTARLVMSLATISSR